MEKQGWFGIGIENPKHDVNIGSLFRTACIFGAKFIFTIGGRYEKQASDTLSSYTQIPFIKYPDLDTFKSTRPYDCRLIGVELDDTAIPIKDYQHLNRCIYLLGAEDNGLTKKAVTMCNDLIVLPGTTSLNVAVAGSIVIFDRINKQL